MNKNTLKSTLMVALVAVAGYGSYKAYKGYVESSNWLLLENVEAMSEIETVYKLEIKQCWKEEHELNYLRRYLCGTEEEIFYPDYGPACLCPTKTVGASINSTPSWCYTQKQTYP